MINGDLGIFGRVYIGFSGNGFAYGEPATTAAAKQEVQLPTLLPAAAWMSTSFADGWVTGVRAACLPPSATDSLDATPSLTELAR